MNEPYAPTTSDFREVWAGFNGYGGLVARPHSVTTDEGYAEFDRWMAKVKAVAWRQGVIQGHDCTEGPECWTNPYEADQ